MPPISSKRNEDRDQRDADGQHREPDLLRPFERRLERVHAVFDVARDVFDHHDRVVHHKSGGNGQRHQRQIVDAETRPGTSRRRFRSAKRERRRSGSRWSAGFAGKETPPGSPGMIEISSVISTSWTEARMVMVWSMATRRLMARGMEAFQLRQCLANAVDRVDNVRAGLPEHDHQHRWLAVGVAGVAQVFHRIHGLARRRRSAPPRRCDRRSPAARNRWR